MMRQIFMRQSHPHHSSIWVCHTSVFRCGRGWRQVGIGWQGVMDDFGDIVRVA